MIADSPVMVLCAQLSGPHHAPPCLAARVDSEDRKSQGDGDQQHRAHRRGCDLARRDPWALLRSKLTAATMRTRRLRRRPRRGPRCRSCNEGTSGGKTRVTVRRGKRSGRPRGPRFCPPGMPFLISAAQQTTSRASRCSPDCGCAGNSVPHQVLGPGVLTLFGGDPLACPVTAVQRAQRPGRRLRPTYRPLLHLL